MDLSLAYDYLPYDLLKTKRHAYGLDKSVLILLIVTYVFGNKRKKLALCIRTALTLLGVFCRDPF